MKAALGGAAGAAAFVAPKIGGFSVTPDYAAAASGTNQTPNATINSTRRNSGTAYYCEVTCCATCWNDNGIYVKCAAFNCTCGNSGNDNQGCGNSTNNRFNGTLTVNKNSGGPITLNYSIWGMIGQCETPSLNMTLAGVDPPHQNCTVTVNGTTNAGGFRILTNDNNTSSYSQNFAGNNPLATPIPTLRPRTVNDPNLCNTNGTVTITLACNFA